MNQELEQYIKENLKQEEKNTFRFSVSKFFKEEEDSLYEEDREKDGCFYDAENVSRNSIKKEMDDASLPPFLYSKDSPNIEDFIQDNKMYSDFQTTLFQMIDDRNLIDSDVYNKVHMDRRLFSKIRNNKNYHPSKETIILLGLSLELSEEEIEKLLDSASYSLPRNNYYDLIIRFCFMKGIYKLSEVNDLLDQYHCKLLNY